MMLDKKFLNKLRDFGLNSYEAKIWTALLSRGVSSAGELSDISNVPRSRAYDVLESLEKKGFIVMKLDKPIKYIAVQPEEVIERVKKSLREDADKQAFIVEELRKDPIFKELDQLYTKGVDVIDPTELSGALKERQNVYSTMNTMINSAEKTVVIMTSAKGLMRKADALKRSLDKAKQRGVKVHIAAPLTKETQKAVELLSKFAEVRHVDEVKARFCLVDSRQLVFHLLDDEKAVPAYDVGIWVTTPFFASAVESMFDKVWQNKKK